jgi:putative SOS response-associated peptidase YedK
MCGRYTSTSTVGDLASIFEVEEVRAEPQPPRYNVAPSLDVYAIALRSSRDGTDEKGPRRALGTFRWGLVPSWAKGPAIGNRLINARAEGIASKPAFRAAVARRRCIIPADAFYEWQRRKKPDGKPAGKLPYAIRRKDGVPMALAGIWEVWSDEKQQGDTKHDAERVRTCAIVTTEANELMAPIHDRMPVVLAPESWAAWLDPATEADVVQGLMVPAPSEWFEAFPVSTLVNNVRNDGPELIDPLPDPPSEVRS